MQTRRVDAHPNNAFLRTRLCHRHARDRRVGFGPGRGERDHRRGRGGLGLCSGASFDGRNRTIGRGQSLANFGNLRLNVPAVVADRAHVILPHHIEIDGLREASAKDGKIGNSLTYLID